MRKKEEDKIKRGRGWKESRRGTWKRGEGRRERTFMSELISATLELLIMYKIIVGRVSLNFAL